jgi:glycosyltransferase involved in cell wall biosynthesis
MNHKVSILIPAHNCEDTIERSLSSLAEQSFKDFEVILVLNNCEDQTEEIARKFSNNFKLKITSNSIPGIVPTLNKGIFCCSSDLIARQDGDDYWYPDKLEKQLEFLEKNSNVDILGTQIKLVDKNYNEAKESLVHPQEDNDIKIKLLRGNNAIAHPSVIFKKKIFLQAGIYEDNYRFAEDYYLWLKCMRWYNFANLGETLVDYTISHNPEYNPKIPQYACYNVIQMFRQQGLIK